MSQGTIIPVEQCSGNTIVIAGDYTTADLYIGNQYCFRYRFSPQYLKRADGGGLMPRGRFQFKRITVDVSETQYFQYQITPEISGTTYTYEFGDGSLGTDETLDLQDDSYTVPVRADADKVTVDLVNCSPYPSNFISATMEGEYSPKARGIR
jgi:hypothetical protein